MTGRDSGVPSALSAKGNVEVKDVPEAGVMGKRQRAAAVQDAGALFDARGVWRSFWSAPVLWRFFICHNSGAGSKSSGIWRRSVLNW